MTKNYTEFPSGTYDTEKIFLQADPVTGSLQKVNLPQQSAPERFGIEDVTANVNRFVSLNNLDFTIVEGNNISIQAQIDNGDETFSPTTLTINGLQLASITRNYETETTFSSNTNGVSGSTTDGLSTGSFYLSVTQFILDVSQTILQADEYADNDAAVAAGLPAGCLYRTGDVVKIVH